jgi:hypothetical protein
MDREEKALRARGPVIQAFEKDCILLKMTQLLPGKMLRKTVKASKKYRQIVASIEEVGIVEPPVVARHPQQQGSFFILDGHLRVEALKGMGQNEVECLVATDDEAFTYNKRISRLAAVQEYAMIMNAIQRGVPEEKIAKALAVNIETIRRRTRMLTGVCDEAAGLLKDKNCPMALFETIKKMKPLRQIEAAELMNNANNYSVAYASAILAGTPQSQLTEPDRPKQIKGMSPEAIARMESELARLQESMSAIQDSYGKDHLQLTVVKGYLTRLLNNGRVVRYLMQSRPEFLPEFQAIADIKSTLPPEAA